MSGIEAFLLGLLQGLTEFLPVSSSGHLELGKAMLGVETTDSLLFTVLVHGATVLSTVVIFRKEIASLLRAAFQFKWNEDTQFLVSIGVSMLPIMVVGLFFKDSIKLLFSEGNIPLVGSMLVLTAIILALTTLKTSCSKKISYLHALVIGVAQCVAILPGVSRSGTTIATGLLLGTKKELVTRFSFLMVLIPILGENFLELLSGEAFTSTSMPVSSLLIGFVTAFVSGLFACSYMIKIVQKGKLIYFSLYCLVVGLSAILYSVW